MPARNPVSMPTAMAMLSLLQLLSVTSCDSIALAPTVYDLDDGCFFITGSVELTVVACADASDARCSQERFTGALQATREFTAATLNTKLPVEAFSGSSVATDSIGSFFGSDDGSLNLYTGDFVSHIQVSGGTGGYANTTGDIDVTAQLDVVSGLGAGSYSGHLCNVVAIDPRPGDDDDDDDNDDDDDDDDDDDH